MSRRIPKGISPIFTGKQQYFSAEKGMFLFGKMVDFGYGNVFYPFLLEKSGMEGAVCAEKITLAQTAWQDW